MPDERCKGCEEPLVKGDTVSYCNSGPCECEGPFCGECFDDHKSAHRMAESMPDNNPLTPAEIATTCPKCGADESLSACISPFLQQTSACRIRELERTLASRDAEIARLKRPRDFVSECNSLLAAKDAEIDRLRAALAGKESI